MNTQNPLLNEFQTKDQSVPFNEIQAGHFLPAIQVALEKAKANLEQIRSATTEPTFDNTILALETSAETLESISNIYSNLFSAEADEELQALAKEISPIMAAFMSDITLDEKIFSRIQTLFNQKNSLLLNAEQLKLLEKYYKDFVRNGALLNAEQKTILRKMDQDLSTLGPQFAENSLKATNAFELWLDKKEDLAGLPEGAIEAAAIAAKDRGRDNQWLFTLHAPSLLPFLQYSEIRELREKLWKASSSKAFGGQFDNQELIKKIVGLRHERAKLLGFNSHAEFVLADRMAEKPESVFKFLEELLVPSLKAAKADIEELKELKKRLSGNNDLQPWDISFYSEKLKEEKFKLNEEELRPYFKIENVIEGLFTYAQKLYDLQFKEITDISVYHKDVKTYEVTESTTGKYIGLLYMDFFPRKTKKSGGWMTAYREQGLTRGQVRRPHISIVCNFTKPTDTKPSLLTYDEVTTLFHEFGHSLHGLLSDCTYRSIAGTNVMWDFVELPSQIAENWAGEQEGLALFAKHYQTNEPIPMDLVQKIKDSQKFQAGYSSLRQISFGLLDMTWHSVNPNDIHSVDEFEKMAIQKTQLLPRIDGTNFSCGFGHIFAGGYSAGYYSYKWAEVLDADAFEYFKEKGIFNKEVATAFKQNILSQGASDHPMNLYKKFRGREPDPKALLRRSGLL